MAIVVEDGTGKSNATSLTSVAFASTWWTARGDSVGWGPLSTTIKEQALVRASDYLRNQKRYRWRGTKLTFAQTMPWPRSGATERDGNTVPSDVVPWAVQEATAYLAGRMVTENLMPDLARGGEVTAESVGPISVTYAAGAPAYTTLQVVDGLLAPLCRGTADDPFTPFDVAAEAPSTFEEGTYEFNG